MVRGGGKVAEFEALSLMVVNIENGSRGIDPVFATSTKVSRVAMGVMVIILLVSGRSNDRAIVADEN